MTTYIDETDGVPAPSDFEPLGEYVLEDAARKLAERLSFNAYCREYGVWGVRKEFHDWLVANHDHEGGDIRPAWDWMLLYEEFGPSARHDDGADELSDPEIMGRRF